MNKIGIVCPNNHHPYFTQRTHDWKLVGISPTSIRVEKCSLCSEVRLRSIQGEEIPILYENVRLAVKKFIDEKGR